MSSAAALRPRFPLVVRVTHWAGALLLGGMIASGLQIYGAYPHLGPREDHWPNLFDGTHFPGWMRLGGWLAGGLSWHFTLAWFFVLTGLVYVGFLVVTRLWRDFVFRPRELAPAWRQLLYYARVRREPPPAHTSPLGHARNPLQRGGYFFIVLLGAFSVVTGLVVYKPVQLAPLTWLLGGFQAARAWHFLAVWIFVAFTIAHVFMVFVVDRARGLRPMTFPRRGASTAASGEGAP